MSILDEQEAPIWWEPWTPKVGDRVRVRLSGECTVTGRISHGEKVWVGRHPQEWDGLEGTVVDCQNMPSYPHTCTGLRSQGHRWAVKAKWLSESRIGHFATTELEPLDPES